MTIKALIAARSGSVRVQNKNIRKFHDSNLLEIKIRQLLDVSNIDGIVVNSNDDEILEIASRYDVELVKRDSFYASNEISMSAVYRNMAENIRTDVVVYANATSPLIKTSTIKQIIDFFYAGGDFDSVNSSHAIKEFMFLERKPINYNLKSQPRSQDLPNIQALNFAVSVLARDLMIHNENVVGSNPYLYEMDEVQSIDIDTPLDFSIAEYLYEKYYEAD